MRLYVFSSSTSLSPPSLLGALGLFIFSGSALANPEGGTVSTGAATIQGQGSRVVQVNQSTDRAVIDWNSFDIAPGEVTRFQQPSASSAILNRIYDQDPSQIQGSLTANGIVALVNPNGMVFGQGSRIDVGSLIATSADIPNERFMEGRWLLFGQPGETDAAIVNQGSISVKEGGLAALVAPQVTNAGVIQAKMGRVALGAGEIFSVDLYGDGLVSLAASDKLRQATVEQKGGIRAEGGTVMLTTAEAKRVMDQTINMDGWMDVSSLTAEAGSIVLHAAQGTTEVGGKLHADGAVGQGGKLQVTGEHVRVGAGAILTALGTGGGDIKIGGDYLGGGTTPRAKTARIESGAMIDASATGQGQGGRVIAWSDERTEFGGLIRVKGGLLGGDGGFVETSSKEILVAHGLVDASSPYGKGGLWLLDPNNITINTTADTNVAGNPNFTTTNDNAVVTVASIQAALDGGTSVSITTGTAGGNSQTGDITVSNSITKSAGGNASLSLTAHGSILVNAGIASTAGELDVTLRADSDNSGAGRIAVTNASITTNGGDVVMGGGANPLADEAVGTTNYGVELNNGDISTDGGSISIRGRGEAAGADNYGVYVHNGSVLQTTGGNITLTGIGGNSAGNNDYGVHVQDAGTLITSADGDILITGTGGTGGDANIGIYVQAGADITSTGTGAGAGNITLDGTGNGGSDNYGVYVEDAGTTISTLDGDIQITGQGPVSTGGGNVGIHLFGSSVSSTGTGANAGAITMNGTGGGGTDQAIGILHSTGAVISSAEGDITLTGTAGSGTGTQAVGIVLYNGADINSTGAGAGAANISLIGTGGTAAGGANEGIYQFTSADVTSAGPATITYTGQAGTVSGSDIRIDTGANVLGGAAAGDITLIGNTMNFANLTASSAEDITLKPRTANTTVGLAGGAGTLNLTAAELAFFNPGGTFILGGSDSGDLTVNARNWGGEDMQFRSSGAGVINVAGAQTNIDDLTITADADPTIGFAITGTGVLTLEPATNGTTMGLGGGAGALNYSSGDLTALGTNWSSYVFGSPTQTGALTTAAHTWSKPVTWRSAAGGSIVISGLQDATAASNATFTFDGPTTLNADVSTVAATGGTRAIDFNSSVILGADAQMLAGSGTVSFDSPINGAHDLTVNSTGAVTFSGVIGGTTPIEDLTITTDTDPTVSAAVNGTGILTLQPSSNGTTMGLGGGAGALNYSSGDLTALGTGWSSYVFGSPTQTGALTTAAHTWSKPVTWRSAAGGSIVISGLQDATAASNATFTFDGPTMLNANVSTAAATGGTQDITFNDDVTLTANAQVLVGNGNLFFSGTVDGAFDLTLNSAGAITLADDVGAGTPLDDLTITSDADPTIGGTVDGTGVLTLQQASNATTMGIAGGAGALNYSLADLAGLGSNWTSLRFGSTTATGALTVGANAWDSPVTYRSAAAGSIVISGAQTAMAASDAAFTFSGPVALNAGVSTSGATGGTGAILFSDDVTLGANVTVNGGSGGTITFSDIVNGAQDLTLSAGGEITLNGVVGGVTPLDDLTITTNANPAINANVSGGGILTLDTLSAGTTMGLGGAAGTVNYSAAELGRFSSGWTLINIGNTAQTGATTVDATAWSDPVHFRANAAGSVVISGAQTAGAASDTTFTFTGPASLAANVDTTNATGGTQDITFNNAATLTANAQVLAGNGDIAFSSTIDGAFDLTLNAAGAITLTGNVGGTTPLDDLTITSDADPTIGGTVEGAGVLTLQQRNNATTMGVAGGAGALNYAVADLADFTGWSSIRLGSTTATGALTVGANAWDVPVTYRSAAGGSIVISGAQTATAVSDATFTFSGPTSLGANVSTVAATGGTQDITFSDDVTLTGNAQVLAGNGDILFSGTVDGAFDLALSAAGTITLTDDVGAATPLDDLTLTSNADPTIGGSVDGTGILTLQQASNGTTMGVAGGAGALNYSLADLVALGSNWTSMRFGSPTATGTLTVGANTWDSPVTYRSAAAGSIVISGAQTAGAASDTTFTFSGPTSLAANVSTVGATGGTQDIIFSDDVTLTANTQILAGNGDLSVAGTIDGAFDLTLSAAGTMTLSDDIGAGTPLDDLTLASDADPSIGGSVDGTGVLTLQQASNGTTMGVAGGAGALNYSLADLAALGSNWTFLRFGSPTATGALSVGANAWPVPVEYRAAAAGSIVVTGAQTAVAASDAAFTFSGPTSLAANVSTVGATGGTQDITFNDDVTLTGNAQVLAGGGDIVFSGTLDGAFDLSLNSTGAITLSNDVGAGTPLDDLTIASDADPTIGGSMDGTGILTLQQASNATTMGVAGGAGALNYSLADLAALGSNWTSMRFGSTTATGTLTVGANAWDIPVDYRAAAAGSIVIAGAQTAVAASGTTFTFSGPTSLGANVSTAAATGGTQDITFNDDVTLTANAQVLAGNGDLAFAGTIDGAFDLTLNAAGTITLSDDIGASTPLDDLTITSDADPAIGGTMEGTGILTLQQASNVTTMGVAGGAGAVNYSAADLAGLGANWTSVRLGSPTATGALTVGARAWDIPVDYRAAAAGSIVISGAQTAGAASDTIFTFSGPATINAPLDLSNATGGTQAITFDDVATVNADITSGGGDIAFNDTLSLNADVATGGGDITLADDVTLTGTSSIDTDTTDIGFDGTLNGTFDLTLSTTGDVDFSDDVGTGAALDDLAIAGAEDVTFAGELNAASFTLTGGTGAVMVTDAADITNDLGITTTGTVTFDDALAFGGDMTIDTGASAIAFNGTVDGPGNADLTTTDDITFGDDVGSGVALGDIAMADAADVTFSGTLDAASLALMGGTGAVLVTGAADIANDIGIATTGTVTFDDTLVYGGDAAVDAGVSAIAFNGTVDGPGDFELTTTNDITFGDDVGAVTRLGDVMLDPQHVAAAGVFNVGSFTLSNGTGNVSFLGLDAPGDISIDTDGNITGTYAGAGGMLDAGTGSITATVSFTTLDIAGAAATLSDGFIGAPGVADQAMANLISIGGIAYPVLVPDPAYTFAAFIIGASPPAPPGGGGGGGGAGGSPTPPVLPPAPGTGPGPVTPPVIEPGGRPITPVPETTFDPLLFDIARLQCSAEMMVQSAKLPAGAACGAASAYASWDALLQSR